MARSRSRSRGEKKRLAIEKRRSVAAGGKSSKETTGSASAGAAGSLSAHQRLFGAKKGVEVVTNKPGDGKTFPQKGDKCVMHYTGTLASNGKKFDSSLGKGKPFSFRIGVGQVIRGWDEGVVQMSLGEKATLKIKADFGYGSQGAGSDIPPNADLNFEVELLKIN
mmetsp:Transcript_24227/g.38812  ORF Transcript_24227/g.38812 Transcript_24227/m.38812 type:complete len:165 (-) Transcript_24227:114-608(-)